MPEAGQPIWTAWAWSAAGRPDRLARCEVQDANCSGCRGSSWSVAAGPTDRQLQPLPVESREIAAEGRAGRYRRRCGLTVTVARRFRRLGRPVRAASTAPNRLGPRTRSAPSRLPVPGRSAQSPPPDAAVLVPAHPRHRDSLALVTTDALVVLGGPARSPSRQATAQSASIRTASLARRPGTSLEGHD